MTKLLLAIATFVVTQSAFSQAQDGSLIRLVAGLDEPEEFYCLDIAGWRESLALDNPLQTHTCKKEGGIDQMFHFDGQQIQVSNYDRCLEVAGSSNTTLGGSAVLARECSDDKPLQKFVLNEAGQLGIVDTPFCVIAGAESTAASGPSHMWRSLSITNCDSADKNLSTWQIGLD